MKFLIELFRDPLNALGFRKVNGATDHGKLWSTIFVVWVMWFVTHNPIVFSVGLVFVLGALIFGRSMYTRLIESKTITAHTLNKVTHSASKVEQLKHVIIERDEAEGMQPTHE